jgi:hypothetical protein
MDIDPPTAASTSTSFEGALPFEGARPLRARPFEGLRSLRKTFDIATAAIDESDAIAKNQISRKLPSSGIRRSCVRRRRALLWRTRREGMHGLCERASIPGQGTQGKPVIVTFSNARLFHSQPVEPPRQLS